MRLKQFAMVASVVSVLSVGAAAQQTPSAPQPAKPATDPATTPRTPQGSQPAPQNPTGTVRPGSSAQGMPGDMHDAMKSTTSPAASTFIKNAGKGGTVEVDLAKLAETKATRDDVKAFAKMIEDDHTKANSELMAIAKSKNVTVSPDPTPTQKATKTKLEGLTGAAFDSSYIKAMVEDHTKDIREFTTATKSTDPDVKAFAEKTLPTLKHHLEEAQKLAKSGSAAKK